jgi:hypothetical protein
LNLVSSLLKGWILKKLALDSFFVLQAPKLQELDRLLELWGHQQRLPHLLNELCF